MLYKLIAENGRWKYLNEMIFSNVVWVSSIEDAKKYTLIDDEGKDIPLTKPISEYLVPDKYYEKSVEELNLNPSE